jgi:integrase/recombinase XerD
VLKTWLAECSPAPDGPLSPTRAGGRLSHDAVERLVAKHTPTAANCCPSIKAKNITPHTLRRTAAMSLLRGGVDTSVIALWLGHENPDTTQVYLHADMTIKEQALARIQPPGTSPAATARPTPSWRSSTISNHRPPTPGYADPRTASPPPGRQLTNEVGIIQASA